MGKSQGKLPSIRLRFAKDNRGVTAVEFALVAPVFFLLIVGILEVGLLLFSNQMLDHATHETARLVRTGQAVGSTKEDLRAYFCEKSVHMFCRKGSQEDLVISVQPYDSFSKIGDVPPPKYDPETGSWTPEDTAFNVGGSATIMLLRVSYRKQMLTKKFVELFSADSSGSLVITSAAVFRNEPF
ncbi:TadE/TadG family type IV pilus assembly protein [Polycladidibacter hongkongensis]|uniref:TadE/TadG family type IV pilus assembly protein n=1 Tax=Polycladidibacter hongkongensis TaxID=1647556 RepID=UPI0008300A43|nr:TadE/TadG family type IV pilus assembly protein [Pseudovibrio hongkongensis]